MRARAAIIVLSIAIPAATAGAQDSVADERARRHFSAGASYYEAGEYENALREFQRAYDLSRRPELFYNFHLAHQALGDLENARTYLARYLDEVEEIDNRAVLQLRLQNLEERIREQQPVEPETPAEPASPPPPEPVPELGDGAPPVEPSAPSPAPAGEGGGVPTLAVVSFVVAGVGLAAMAVFGALALGEESSVADSECGRTATCNEDDVSTMDTYALVSDLGLGVAVVGAALGLVFVMTDGSGREQRVSAGAIPGGAAASLRGTF